MQIIILVYWIYYNNSIAWDNITLKNDLKVRSKDSDDEDNASWEFVQNSPPLEAENYKWCRFIYSGVDLGMGCVTVIYLNHLTSPQMTLLDSTRLKNIEVAKRAVAEERQERKK